MKVVLFVLALALAHASPPDDEFKAWMTKYFKHYTSDEEYDVRKTIFEQTKASIVTLKEAEPEAKFVLNKFADLTPEEFTAMYKGRKSAAPSDEGIRLSKPISTGEAASAESFDWRKKEPYPVTPVKNQGQCGSCWAFSATEGIESAWIMEGHEQVILSPQEIVSCDHVDAGCNGGDLPPAFKFVESLDKDKGLVGEKEYPYTSGTTGVTGSCKKDKQNHGLVEVKSAAYAISPCQQGSSCKSQEKLEPQLAEQLMKHGPMSICVNAEIWQTYNSGIIKNSRTCGGAEGDLDHCVQLVGFNKEGATPYWIVRNSWATDWGEEGYIYLEMGKNMCGVADEVMFPTDGNNIIQEPANTMVV